LSSVEEMTVNNGIQMWLLRTHCAKGVIKHNMKNDGGPVIFVSLKRWQHFIPAQNSSRWENISFRNNICAGCTFSSFGKGNFQKKI